MKNEAHIRDWRSTGRRKARKELFASHVPFKCSICGKTSIEPPKDAPPWFDEIWPTDNRCLDYSLQADNETKDLTNNDVSVLSWKCAPCHKESDSQTEKGETTIRNSMW